MNQQNLEERKKELLYRMQTLWPEAKLFYVDVFDPLETARIEIVAAMNDSNSGEKTEVHGHIEREIVLGHPLEKVADEMVGFLKRTMDKRMRSNR